MTFKGKIILLLVFIVMFASLFNALRTNFLGSIPDIFAGFLFSLISLVSALACMNLVIMFGGQKTFGSRSKFDD